MAEEDFPQQTQPQAQVPGMPQLADDDPAENTPAGEVAPPGAPQQPLPPEEPAVPGPTGPEDQVPEAGELPPEEEVQFDPTAEYEQVVEQESELDKLNQTLSIPEKVDVAVRERQPLRIIYTTLAGHTTERTVDPDYRHVAMTGHDVLVAWCRLRNDWRGFIVERIRAAKLEEKGT